MEGSGSTTTSGIPLQSLAEIQATDLAVRRLVVNYFDRFVAPSAIPWNDQAFIEGFTELTQWLAKEAVPRVFDVRCKEYERSVGAGPPDDCLDGIEAESRQFTDDIVFKWGVGVDARRISELGRSIPPLFSFFEEPDPKSLTFRTMKSGLERIDKAISDRADFWKSKAAGGVKPLRAPRGRKPATSHLVMDECEKMKLSGQINRETAKVMYNTDSPTESQIKSVSTRLKSYRKTMSKQVG